jgi:three-Cys-motif partner protein
MAGKATATKREWGPWTSIKLDALEKYLAAFTTASSKRAPHTLYLDLFAGGAENVDRGSGRQVMGSPIRALSVRPPFSRLVFWEISRRRATELDTTLRRSHPGRNFHVVPEDCNTSVAAVLADLERERGGWRKAPAFAFVDQFSAQIQWSTLIQLAEFRQGKTKVEQWIFFGASFILRGLYGTQGARNWAFAERVDLMFGTDRWRCIAAAREDDAIDAETARFELVNLFRWRLQHDLRYADTIALRVPNTMGHDLYELIYATDHDAGRVIMTSVVSGAERALEQMQDERRIAAAVKRLVGAGDDLFGAVEGANQFRVADHIVLPAAASANQRSPLGPVIEPFEYPRRWQA